MKKYIAVLLILLWASTASALVGVKVTADGAAFPLGLDFEGTPNWDPAVASVHKTTGIESGCKVTVSAGDNTKIDIGSPCVYHIAGPQYTLTNVTSINPQFAANENSRFIGVTMNGYTTQTSRWTAIQQRTILPIARLNTELGVLGPGSPTHLVRDDRYIISEGDYFDSLWMQDAIGALYARGGELFANATSNLVLGQYSGVLYNAARERQVLGEFNNMSAIFRYYSSNGIDLLGVKKPLVVDNVQYDTGAGLADITSQRWTKISILKSPKGVNGTQEGGWFYVYGGEYLTQTGAEDAPFDFGDFINQGTSGITPLAEIVIKRDADVIDTDYFIIDKRSCLVCRP
jgi:hypothetical protein